MGKICNKCGNLKDIQEFCPRKDSKDGFRNTCKTCANIWHRKYSKSDKAKVVMRRYRQTLKGRASEKRCRDKYRSTIRGYLVNIYAHIKERCCNPKHPKYKYYGGRGIQNKFESSVCFADYVIYKLEIDPHGFDCDRIDGDGHYEPGNIQFITHEENINKRIIKKEMLQ